MPQSHSKPPLDVTCACRATEPPRRHDHGGQSTGSWPPSWGCHNDIVADGFEPTWRTARTASLAGPRPSGSYLPRHLSEVAEGAQCRGRMFGAEALAELAGLAHDLGKYGADFQARLRDPSRRADHSAAGAVWAAKYLPQKWGRLLAHVIAGHHAGLADDLVWPRRPPRDQERLVIARPMRAAQADGYRAASAASPSP